MSVFKSPKSLSVVVAVSFCGMGGYLLYQYLRHSGSRNKIVRVLIPSVYVGFIIGRRGQRLHDLERETGARIEFHENTWEASKEATCVITGDKNACYMAENLIKIIINEKKALLCEHIYIPQQAVGNLIGVGGYSINAICNATGARITVDKNVGSCQMENGQRRVTLKGTKVQIEAAKTCIDGIVTESDELHASLAKREPRSQSKFAVEERLGSIPGNSLFEVYVSAMIDPSRFWLQIVGPKAQELDLLVEEMTEYYKVPENRVWHKLDAVGVGDLVAATFQYDERWYRAEVLDLNEEKDVAELYYVDYGDTERVATIDLYELQVNYLQLHFQAIECFLSRIEPVDGAWTSEAVDKFEEWAHVAHWRKLSAKVTNYSCRQRTRAQRGSSPVPGVELFDVVNTDTDINIGEELVRQGYAAYKRTPSSSRSSSSIDWERC